MNFDDGCFDAVVWIFSIEEKLVKIFFLVENFKVMNLANICMQTQTVCDTRLYGVL